MPLPIDSSRALRTLDELCALIKAIRDAPASESETDALEWKSAWDLNDANKCFETAKHLLGLGNRSVIAASKVFEGCAYFLAGVEPGNLCGVSPLDPATINDKLSRYIESGKPRWSPQYVVIDGHDVLVLTVESPNEGDPICTLQKGFDKVSAGRIFVRKHGKTEEAGPADIRELENRSNARRPQVELSVSRANEDPLPVISVPTTAREAWLKSEQERLALPPPRKPPAPGIFDLPQMPNLAADPRSRESYSREVSEYLKRANRYWDAQLIESAMTHEIAVLGLLIENSTERNYNGVEVVLEIPSGPTVWHETDEVKNVLEAPTPPKPWEKKGRFEFAPPDISDLGFQGPVEIDRKPELTIVRFSPEHVRPRAKVLLPILHLTLFEELSELEILWQLTSSSVGGQVTGVITCSVSNVPVVPQFDAGQ